MIQSRAAVRSSRAFGIRTPSSSLWRLASRSCALALGVLWCALLGSAPAFAATVNGLTITESLPQGSRGTTYSHTITVTGGTGPYTFAVIAPNNLPANLVLSAGGVLRGVISCAGNLNGNYKQQVRITDSSSPTPIVADFTSNANQLAFNVTTGPAVCVPLTLSPGTLPSPTAGVPYAQTISVTNGVGPYTFAVTSGTLPGGLTLNTATGQITGTATTSGAYSVTITATDAATSTGSLAYSGSVLASLSLNPSSLPATTVNVAYSQTVTAAGGTAPYTFSLAGSLPGGLALNASTGAITGTTSASGTFNFTINATDAQGAAGSRAYSIVVNPAISIAPASLPATTQGIAYNQTLSASGGTGGKTYAVTAGTLPAGLSLDLLTGAITGTPSAAGTSNFTITATDTVGATASRSYSVTVNAALVLAPATLPAPTVGSPYSQSVSATGGTGSISYSVSAGALPTGLSLNTATGAITGTPSSGGPFNFTVTATDSLGATASVAYSVTVAVVTLAIGPANLPNWTQGLAYSQSVTASGGTGSYTYALTGSPPTGLTLNTSTGALTGTPSAAGTFNFTVTATDGLGATGSRAYSMAINPAMTVNPATLPAPTVGSAYNQTASVVGGTGAATFAISAGALPAGLSLNGATGAITGTPTTAGAANFTITATDQVGATASRAYSFTVVAVTLTVGPTTLPATTQGLTYSQTIVASAGTAPYTYSASGALPTGLSLNTSTGAIVGTSTAAGTFNFTVTATDSLGSTGSRVYSVVVNPAISVDPASLPATSQGAAYSQTVTASGGTGAKIFAVTAGALPTGLSLNAATGAVSGTASAPGSFNFTITATDTVGATGAQAYSVVVNSAITVAPGSLPATTVGVPYSQSFSYTGGTGSASYTVSAGSLPAGLSLNASTGVLSGTASAAGTSNFTITVVDSLLASGSRAYTLIVNAALVVNPATLPAPPLGAGYSQSVSATGGTGAITFSVSAGSLPTGLTLNGVTGAITGTASAVGTFNFTVTATDSVGATGSRAYSVTLAGVTLTVNPATLLDTTQGLAFSQTITASGGTGAKTFAVTAGALPTGLSLNAVTGAITGTSTAAGMFNFTITATDSVGQIGDRPYLLLVNAAVAVNPATLPTPTLGSAYSQSVSATGGTGAITFSVSAGALPAGLSLNGATGAITGTPTTAGAANFTITATDQVGATASRAYSFTVVAVTLTVGPTTLPATTLGLTYSQTIVASAGTAPYTYALGGALPTGLSLNTSTGAITGTSTAAGTFNFTVTATDSLGSTGNRAYSVVVNPPVAVTLASLPAASFGAAYSQTIVATGGTGAVTFSVTAGALPTGLALSSTGALTGTPNAAGTFNFTVTATDGLGATGSRAYSVAINPAMTLNPATLPAGVVGAAYSQTVTAIGGSGAYTYSVTAGSLPAGLTLNAASGVIAGTSTTAGTANFTITATDGLGATAARAYVLTLNAAMTLNPATLPVGMTGTAYSQALAASGGSGSYTFSVSAGSLPPGFALNASTGVLSGMPAGAGSYAFGITVTDSLGASVTRSYTLTLNAAVTVGPATLPSPVVGTAYSQAVTGSGGTGTYAFSISAGNLPTGMALTAATGTIYGVPTSGGTWSFTITATDDLGFTGNRAYVLTVLLPTLTLTPGVVNGAVGTPYSTMIAVSGGSAPYSFAITGGQLPAGLTLNPSTGALTGVPSAPGSYAFTVTVTDSNGASGSFTATIDVAARPDPTQDPTVRGINASQISSASRFGTAQIGNVNARMQMLHLGHDPCTLSFDVSTNIRWERTDSAAGDKQDTGGDKPKTDGKSACDRAYAVWAGGNIDFGFLRPSSASDRSDFRTEGLTLGADRKIGETLVVGAAIGFGRDETDVDAAGGETRSRGQTFALYASYQPAKQFYVDGVVGYGSLSFDLHRWQSDDRVLLSGDRGGSQWFGSLGAGAVLQTQGVKLAPYARYDHVQSRVDGYSESGNSGLRLTYDALSFSENTIALGVYAGVSLRVGAAVVEPGLRLEQRRVSSSGASQGLAYWDAPAAGYVLHQAAESDNRTSGALSVMLRFGVAASLGFEYSYTGSDSFRNESLRAIVRVPF